MKTMKLLTVCLSFLCACLLGQSTYADPVPQPSSSDTRFITPNLDDDDMDGVPDAQDDVINGLADRNDLTPIEVEVSDASAAPSIEGPGRDTFRIADVKESGTRQRTIYLEAKQPRSSGSSKATLKAFV